MPRTDLPGYPPCASVNALELVIILPDRFSRQRTLVDILPALRDFGIDIVVRPAEHLSLALAEIVKPELAGREIAHLAAEDGNGYRRLFNNGAELRLLRKFL